MYIYRIKTKKELILEYNLKENKSKTTITPIIRHYFGFNGFGYMDYLMGKVINVPSYAIGENKDVIKNFKIPYKNYKHLNWNIYPKMIKKIPLPNYKPRKIIY